jgi:hypothetical protein
MVGFPICSIAEHIITAGIAGRSIAMNNLRLPDCLIAWWLGTRFYSMAEYIITAGIAGSIAIWPSNHLTM